MDKIAIGVDIGGTYTKFGLVNEEGQILSEGSIATTGYPSFADYGQYLKKSIDEKIAKLDTTVEVMGMGVGAPNGNYYKGTIEHAPNLEWKGIVPCTDTLKSIFNVEVVLTNDANAAAIGEKLFGGAQGMDNFIVITLGTGLGSGIVVNGDLVYGHDGFAGELGHTTLEENGRMCGTGMRGCLEAYCSATGIKRTAFALMAESMDDSVLRDYSFRQMDAKIIYDAAMQGDLLALQAFERTGTLLGKKLAEFVAFSSPEAIFILGGLAKAGDMIIKPIKDGMEKNLIQVFRDKVSIRPSALNDVNAAIIGAAALAWKELKR